MPENFGDRGQFPGRGGRQGQMPEEGQNGAFPRQGTDGETPSFPDGGTPPEMPGDGEFPTFPDGETPPERPDGGDSDGFRRQRPGGEDFPFPGDHDGSEPSDGTDGTEETSDTGSNWFWTLVRAIVRFVRALFRK